VFLFLIFITISAFPLKKEMAPVPGFEPTIPQL